MAAPQRNDPEWKKQYMKQYRKKKKKEISDLLVKVQKYFTTPASRTGSLDDLIAEMRQADVTWRNLTGKASGQPHSESVGQGGRDSEPDEEMPQVKIF